MIEDADYLRDLFYDRGDSLPHWEREKREAWARFCNEKYREEHGLDEPKKFDFFNPPRGMEVI